MNVNTKYLKLYRWYTKEPFKFTINEIVKVTVSFGEHCHLQRNYKC